MVTFGVAQLFLLGMCIAARISLLLGFQDSDSPVGQTIQALARTNTKNDAPPQTGDFIAVILDQSNIFLAQVIETVTTEHSTYGVRVRYLAERPYGNLEEDEIPSTHVHGLVRFREVMDEMVRQEPKLLEIAEADRADGCRAAIIEIWTRGLRGLYLRHLAGQ